MAIEKIVRLPRGPAANLAGAQKVEGLPYFTTDQHTLHIGIDASTAVPVVPAIAQLTAIGAVDGAADLLMMWDASASQATRITLNALRTALNIPSGSTDELVAPVSGGTAGYLGDVLTAGDSSILVTATAAGVTVEVNEIDCGTF